MKIFATDLAEEQRLLLATSLRLLRAETLALATRQTHLAQAIDLAMIDAMLIELGLNAPAIRQQWENRTAHRPQLRLVTDNDPVVESFATATLRDRYTTALAAGSEETRRP